MQWLKENYRLARCCNPAFGDSIVGFHKTDVNLISVHKKSCANLKSILSDRLLTLTWDEILFADKKPSSSHHPDYKVLDDIDFNILKHHQVMGVDYAAVVARKLNLSRQTVFERHKKLKELLLLKRVQPRMIQYRKNIVKNKWIKHRNHTYYEITPKGREFLRYYCATQ